jgi:hypothetical protein
MNLTNPINVTNAVQKLISPPAPMMQEQNNRSIFLSALPDTFSGRAVPCCPDLTPACLYRWFLIDTSF